MFKHGKNFRFTYNPFKLKSSNFTIEDFSLVVESGKGKNHYATKPMREGI